MWISAKTGMPPEGEVVLVRTMNQNGHFVAWWATDWGTWCRPGSRDIVDLDHSPLDTYWMSIPK